MSTDEQQLLNFYRETVLTHSREPHNFRRLPSADREATGHNPLCGDKLTVYLELGDEAIEQVTFEGSGCAISLASASIMTDTITGLPEDAARHEIEAVINQFTADENSEPASKTGAMAALRGVRRYPSRIKCATLAWKTLTAALDNKAQPVSTESMDQR